MVGHYNLRLSFRKRNSWFRWHSPRTPPARLAPPPIMIVCNPFPLPVCWFHLHSHKDSIVQTSLGNLNLKSKLLQPLCLAWRCFQKTRSVVPKLWPVAPWAAAQTIQETYWILTKNPCAESLQKLNTMYRIIAIMGSSSQWRSSSREAPVKNV